jgi:hypothetical protein
MMAGRAKPLKFETIIRQKCHDFNSFPLFGNAQHISHPKPTATISILCFHFLKNYARCPCANHEDIDRV